MIPAQKLQNTDYAPDAAGLVLERPVLRFDTFGTCAYVLKDADVHVPAIFHDGDGKILKSLHALINEYTPKYRDMNIALSVSTGMTRKELTEVLERPLGREGPLIIAPDARSMAHKVFETANFETKEEARSHTEHLLKDNKAGSGVMAILYGIPHGERDLLTRFAVRRVRMLNLSFQEMDEQDENWRNSRHWEQRTPQAVNAYEKMHGILDAQQARIMNYAGRLQQDDFDAGAQAAVATAMQLRSHQPVTQDSLRNLSYQLQTLPNLFERLGINYETLDQGLGERAERQRGQSINTTNEARRLITEQSEQLRAAEIAVENAETHLPRRQQPSIVPDQNVGPERTILQRLEEIGQGLVLLGQRAMQALQGSERLAYTEAVAAQSGQDVIELQRQTLQQSFPETRANIPPRIAQQIEIEAHRGLPTQAPAQAPSAQNLQAQAQPAQQAAVVSPPARQEAPTEEQEAPAEEEAPDQARQGLAPQIQDLTVETAQIAEAQQQRPPEAPPQQPPEQVPAPPREVPEQPPQQPETPQRQFPEAPPPPSEVPRGRTTPQSEQSLRQAGQYEPRESSRPQEETAQRTQLDNVQQLEESQWQVRHYESLQRTRTDEEVATRTQPENVRQREEPLQQARQISASAAPEGAGQALPQQQAPAAQPPEPPVNQAQAQQTAHGDGGRNVGAPGPLEPQATDEARLKPVTQQVADQRAQEQGVQQEAEYNRQANNPEPRSVGEAYSRNITESAEVLGREGDELQRVVEGSAAEDRQKREEQQRIEGELETNLEQSVVPDAVASMDELSPAEQQVQEKREAHLEREKEELGLPEVMEIAMAQNQEQEGSESENGESEEYDRRRKRKRTPQPAAHPHKPEQSALVHEELKPPSPKPFPKG